jgi:iron complex transport system substrate-binding protein
VIASVPYQLEAVAEILKAGVRFLGLAPRSLADIYADIALIAGAMGVSERGQHMIESMQREIECVRARHAAGPRPRVFCEEWGKPIIHSQPWVAELVEAAGGQFLGEPGAKTDAECVRRADPEVIIMAWCGAGDRVPLEKIVGERGWTETSAGRSRRVYCVRDELLNTPAPTLLEGLRALEAAIHPESFPQLPAGLRRAAEYPA